MTSNLELFMINLSMAIRIFLGASLPQNWSEIAVSFSIIKQKLA